MTKHDFLASMVEGARNTYDQVGMCPNIVSQIGDALRFNFDDNKISVTEKTLDDGARTAKLIIIDEKLETDDFTRLSHIEGLSAHKEEREKKYDLVKGTQYIFCISDFFSKEQRAQIGDFIREWFGFVLNG